MSSKKNLSQNGRRIYSSNHIESRQQIGGQHYLVGAYPMNGEGVQYNSFNSKILSQRSLLTNKSSTYSKGFQNEHNSQALMNDQNSNDKPVSVNGRSIQQQKQRTSQNFDSRSPLVTLIPTSVNPTEILAARFSSWRVIIKAILVYLTETASVQEELVRQHTRLTNALNFPFFSVENVHQPNTPEEKSIQHFFLPFGNNSVQDLPTILCNYHAQMASTASSSSKELVRDVIPRLQDMRRDLLVKIKEIKSLQSDFKNTCSKEVADTKQQLKVFHESLEQAKYGTPKNDPYLTRIILEKQIKRQLNEENFLHEAFINLQSSGKELEKVVFSGIQNAFNTYAKILGKEAQIAFDIIISRLDIGFLGRDPTFEWDHFLSRDSNFIDPELPMRHLRDISYKHQYDPLTYKVLCGFLERRSKFLKSYSRGFYVLTPSFLHEFKTCDRKKDLFPVMSLSLSDCTVAEHSKKDSADFKFILHAKQNGIIHRGHNWVFRVDSYDSMMEWFRCIKKLTTMGNSIEKSRWVSEYLRLNTDDKVMGNSSMRDNQSNTTHVSSNVGSPSNVMQGVPVLDGNTNTNTTLSSPSTSYLPDQADGAEMQIPVSNKKITSNIVSPKVLR